MSQEAKNILKKLSNQEKIINYRKLYLKGGNNSEYDFTGYRSLLELFKAIYYRNISIEEAEAIQEEFDGTHGALEKYKPKQTNQQTKNSKYVEPRRKLLINAKKIYNGREMRLKIKYFQWFLLVLKMNNHQEMKIKRKKR